ncbi:Conserved exported protein of unknown function [Bradyrhizobium sp. ORS 285]|uniref:hypothetical protein n=1 Tax=Bradyrhizobium sp. ORS 285 TaxID=115808 RepID=UPI000B569A87|nr:hypothetical protein [Bradyrhizobium sp. ORS 285]SMX60094.1 Conserved exported protein of unknown function [Bradyrhizobium sp. ORS 285]
MAAHAAPQEEATQQQAPKQKASKRQAHKGQAIKEQAIKGPATVEITRTTDLLFMGVNATVEINGAKMASLGRGESYSGQLTSGETTITVSAWSSPGSSNIRFNAEPGKTYRMLVGPRGNHFGAAMVGGLLGAAIEGGGAFEIVPAK